MKKGKRIKKAPKNENEQLIGSFEPKFVSKASASSSPTTTRRNAAATIERSDRFSNIEQGLTPFQYTNATSNVSIRQAVVLCQKAYYNFAIFRNTIDLMTEFTVNDILFKGGNKKSRDFFQAYWKRINGWGVQDRFYREYFRSGNVFLFRFDGLIAKEDVDKITQVYGASNLLNNEILLPIKYVILNPADIVVGGNISFAVGNYFKALSNYEAARLKNPITEEDKEVYNALPQTVKNQLRAGGHSVLLPLDPEKLNAVFYKKQDYEPLAVPMGYPVLDDINWKAELRKMDMAITRTMQQAILLVTMGAKKEDGGTNPTHLEAMRTLFENQSVGRVLVADYTTKAEFVLPDIANLLDPKKYESVDRDIALGLNYILLGGEKFANSKIKVQVFVERLKQARNAFIYGFLMDEVKRVSKILGFKTYPTPYYEDIDLDNELEYTKIYTRLMEIGVLTPEEGIDAMENGRLPTSEDSIESQQKFRELKDKGFYEPVVGGPFSQQKLANSKAAQSKLPGASGRPAGTTAPQSKKKISPIGASYSLSKVTENLILAGKLTHNISLKLLEKYQLTKLNKDQKELVESLATIIITNENPENWVSKIDDYIKDPVGRNEEKTKEIETIAHEHQLDFYLSGILHASVKE